MPEPLSYADPNTYAGKTVLISGGAGFLGSHLVDRFVAVGARVVVVDNMMSGCEANLATARDDENLSVIVHDIVEPLAAEANLVLNLACPASPPRYQADPLHTLKTSVHGTLNMAEIALRGGARLVHTSTSEIYGDPEVHPQRESYRGAVNPIGPRACYDEGKRAAETVLFDLHRGHGLEIGVCRIFNTYGPRMDPFDGRVVSNLICQALRGDAMTLYGDGSQTRSFCFVDDLVEGIWRLAHAGPAVTGPINLGNPHELTVRDLAETIKDLTGSKAPMVFNPLPVDDPLRRRPDISVARETLGWEPTVALQEGLARTIAYFDEIISSGRIDSYAELDRARYKVAGE